MSAKQKDSLRRLVLSEDRRNIPLAASLATGAGMSPEQFERFRAAAIEADNIEGLNVIPPERPVKLHNPETAMELYFYHGITLEYVSRWWGDNWLLKPTGVVVWRSGGMPF